MSFRPIFFKIYFTFFKEWFLYLSNIFINMKLKTLTFWALLNTTSLVPFIGHSQISNHTYQLYVKPLSSKLIIGYASISQNNDSLSARVFVPNEKIDLLLTYNLSTRRYSSNNMCSIDDQESFNVFTAYLSYLDSLKEGTLKEAEFNLKISEEIKRVRLRHILSEENVHTYRLETDEDGLEIANHKKIEYLILSCSPDQGIIRINARRKKTFWETLTLQFKEGLDVHGSLEEKLENK